MWADGYQDFLKDLLQSVFPADYTFLFLCPCPIVSVLVFTKDDTCCAAIYLGVFTVDHMKPWKVASIFLEEICSNSGRPHFSYKKDFVQLRWQPPTVEPNGGAGQELANKSCACQLYTPAVTKYGITQGG